MAQNVPDFHAFTITFTGLANKIISDLEVFPAFDPTSQPIPKESFKTRALWDTGATKSVITSAVVQNLGLQPINQIQVNHGGGSEIHNVHIVNFGLPNRVGIPGILVTENPNIKGDFEALIGMDIISQGDFSITNCNGLTCATYRYPSVKTIDYVEEANRRNASVVPRNAPCPCGSGKKFKRCCGAS